MGQDDGGAGHGVGGATHRGWGALHGARGGTEGAGAAEGRSEEQGEAPCGVCVVLVEGVVV